MGGETRITGPRAFGLAFVRMHAYTEGMSNTPEHPCSPAPGRSAWPTAPLIRIISGYESGVGLVGPRLAIRDVAGCYRLEGGGLLVPDTGDVIETWEEMRAVPVYRAAQIVAGAIRGDRIEAAPQTAGPARSSR